MDDEIVYLPESVPLFPLPEVVLFPRTILPLHIFEPRYKEMMADVLAGERFLAVALLKPGFEPLYYTPRAPIHAIIGVGHILESEQVDGGNYNLLLRGVGRARILDESRTRSYRVARVEMIETYCSGDEPQSEQLRQDLFNAIRGNPALDRELRRHWLKLRDAELGLDELTDLLAAGVPVEAELRQCLLSEPDAYSRATLLLEQIRTIAAIARTFVRASRPGRQNMN